DIEEALNGSVEPTPATTQVWRWNWVALGTLVFGVLVGAWAVTRLQREPSAAPIYLEIDPPSGSQFEADSLSLSPDGQTLAFVARVKDERMLWVRALNATSTRPIPGTQNAHYPFWSPDGKSIGYFAGNKLWRVDLNGSAPLEICGVSMARGGSW